MNQLAELMANSEGSKKKAVKAEMSDEAEPSDDFKKALDTDAPSPKPFKSKSKFGRAPAGFKNK